MQQSPLNNATINIYLTTVSGTYSNAASFVVLLIENTRTIHFPLFKNSATSQEPNRVDIKSKPRQSWEQLPELAQTLAWDDLAENNVRATTDSHPFDPEPQPALLSDQ